MEQFSSCACSCAPLFNNLKPKYDSRWKGLYSLTKLTFTTDPVAKVPTVLDMIFTSSWLDSKADNDDKGRTNRQIQDEVRLTI